MIGDDDEADEIMKNEACDSLHTFPTTASELHLTPVDFSRTRNPTWTRTQVRLSYLQEVGSVGPGIHWSVSASSKFQPPWTSHLSSKHHWFPCEIESLTFFCRNGLDWTSLGLGIPLPSLMTKKLKSLRACRVAWVELEDIPQGKLVNWAADVFDDALQFGSGSHVLIIQQISPRCLMYPSTFVRIFRNEPELRSISTLF